ncbi:MAG: peptidase [Xenococcus sp. MO_188.B8]|nr:peptidase [Xenococcus sp. MO_188.B8]
MKRSLRDSLVFECLSVRSVRSALPATRSRLIKLIVLAIAFFSLTFLLPQFPIFPNSPSPSLPVSQSSPASPSPILPVSQSSPEAPPTPSLPIPQSPNFPSPKIHPLPPSLAQWQTKDDIGDYFAQIQTTDAGYLVWTKFPLKIYLEHPDSLNNSASNLRFQQWVTAIREAIDEWNNYLPLVEIDSPELADIIVTRSQVDRDIQLDPETGLYKIPRAITAQTTYEFYLSSDTPAVLRHRMKVQISPDIGKNATLATARHELGHAMGIWGHSDRKTDALYFSQVSDPPPISPRDLNTLKKIYQQPTRLGWEISS